MLAKIFRNSLGGLLCFFAIGILPAHASVDTCLKNCHTHQDQIWAQCAKVTQVAKRDRCFFHTAQFFAHCVHACNTGMTDLESDEAQGVGLGGTCRRDADCNPPTTCCKTDPRSKKNICRKCKASEGEEAPAAGAAE